MKGFIANIVRAIHLGRKPSKGGRPPNDISITMIDIRKFKGINEIETNCRVDDN